MPRHLVPSVVVRLIKDTFPFVSQEGINPPQLSGDNAGQLSGLVVSIESIPDELITLTGNDLAQFIESIGRLNVSLDLWINRGVNAATVSGSYLRLVWRLLQHCPDSVPAPTTTALAFVTDETLQVELRRDITSANHALLSADWKAATVLSGSIVEALLLWVLSQRGQADIAAATTALRTANTLQKAPSADLNSWTLHEYLEVSAQIGVINPQTATQARLAKDFRNLIHPGKAIRLGMVCDYGTALAAFAAVQMVARDLTPLSR